MNTNIVKYVPPNLSSGVCSDKFALHLSEVSVIDLFRLLTSRLDICVCNQLLTSYLGKFSSKFKGEHQFSQSLWNYVVINNEVSDVTFRQQFLKDDDYFSDLRPLLCRIMGEILLKELMSSYPTWLLCNGKRNIFCIRNNGVNTTLVVYMNTRRVWIISLYGIFPEKYRIGDQVFQPLIHDFV